MFIDREFNYTEEDIHLCEEVARQLCRNQPLRLMDERKHELLQELLRRVLPKWDGIHNKRLWLWHCGLRILATMVRRGHDRQQEWDSLIPLDDEERDVVAATKPLPSQEIDNPALLQMWGKMQDLERFIFWHISQDCNTCGYISDGCSAWFATLGISSQDVERVRNRVYLIALKSKHVTLCLDYKTTSDLFKRRRNDYVVWCDAKWDEVKPLLRKEMFPPELIPATPPQPS